MIARARLFLTTVRYLGPRQIATRAMRILERAWWRASRATLRTAPAAALRKHVPLWRELAFDADAIARAEEILAGRFTFLGQTREVSGWNAEGASHLWRFHLHYFDYLRDLAVYAVHRDRDAASRKYHELTRSWIDAHQRLGGDAWHPYTTSLRLVNWCESSIVFGDPGLAASIAAQARFLSRHMEHDVRGNHLLENVRGLIRASLMFEDDDETRGWREKALSILEREIAEQVLDDGGHFERAPGYHVRVRGLLADVATMLRENEAPMPALEAAIERMDRFTEAIVPPNGRLPLLKDTVLPRDAMPAVAQPSRWLAASGYAVMRDDTRGDHLIADFGRVCPDYLPAHAHADLFSYELTIGGRPAVVDSGVYEYETGEWRAWFRSTRAHNTVAVDGRDQSEMWGSFRVGRRTHPRDVVWRSTPVWTTIEGVHDAYAPIAHRRIIGHVRDARLWFVIDRLAGPAGHTATSFIHLHPDYGQLAITPFGAARVSEESGWYSERFGEKRANRVIVLTADAPVWFGYVISAGDAAAARIEQQGEAITLAMNTPAWSGEFRF